MINISAVIVTYNRNELLRKALDGLLSQKVPFRNIYIIDNASSDGTKEWCESLVNDHIEKNILYKRLESNCGGAGGFYFGLKAAHQDFENEWIVVLDDDAILPADYNISLEHAIQQYPDVKCFTGNVTRMEYGIKYMRINDDTEYTSVNNFSFVSAVFHRDIITKIGFPEKDYFIWYDDNEYAMRVIKNSRIVSMNRVIVEHLQNDSSMDSLLWKKYYGIRNKLHMIKKHRGKLQYHMTAVETWIMLLGSSIIKQLVVEKSISRYRARRKLIKDAFYDARNNRLGVRMEYMPGNHIK